MADFEQIDATKPLIITILGRKNSGKSVLAAGFWDTYPYDEICIDVTRDALTGPGCQFISELPGRFPAPDVDAGRTRSKLVYQPDPGAATYDDDLDRAIGLAVNNPRHRCMVWIDERGELTVNAGPAMRRAVNQSRHWGLTILSCGPRAVGMPPLLLSNADYLYIFNLPGIHDRRRIAETIGIDERELTRGIKGLPEHGFLQWNLAKQEMLAFPPLPLEYVRSLERANTGAAAPAPALPS